MPVDFQKNRFPFCVVCLRCQGAWEKKKYSKMFEKNSRFHFVNLLHFFLENMRIYTSVLISEKKKLSICGCYCYCSKYTLFNPQNSKYMMGFFLNAWLFNFLLCKKLIFFLQRISIGQRVKWSTDDKTREERKERKGENREFGYIIILVFFFNLFLFAYCIFGLRFSSNRPLRSKEWSNKNAQ